MSSLPAPLDPLSPATDEAQVGRKSIPGEDSGTSVEVPLEAPNGAVPKAHADSRVKASSGIAWAGLIVSVVSLLFAVPAAALAMRDVAARDAILEARRDSGQAVQDALRTDDPEALAEVAALADPGSPAAEFLAAVADATFTDRLNGQLPLILVGSSCTAGSVACEGVDSFAFEGESLVSFRVLGRSVERLIVTGEALYASGPVVVTYVSGYRSPTLSSATVTFEVANLTADSLTLGSPYFSTADEPVGVEVLGEELPSTAACVGGEDLAPYSIGTVSCDLTGASLGQLHLAFDDLADAPVAHSTIYVR